MTAANVAPRTTVSTRAQVLACRRTRTYTTIPDNAAAFSEWPLGKENDVSNGGTASASGGRERPIAALPRIVIASEPAPVASPSSTGSQVRARQASRPSTVVASSGIPIPPPRFVYAWTTAVRVGVRAAMAPSSTGWSRVARPSTSVTSSYTWAAPRVNRPHSTRPTARVISTTPCGLAQRAVATATSANRRPGELRHVARSRLPMWSSARARLMDALFRHAPRRAVRDAAGYRDNAAPERDAPTPSVERPHVELPSVARSRPARRFRPPRRGAGGKVGAAGGAAERLAGPAPGGPGAGRHA